MWRCEARHTSSCTCNCAGLRLTNELARSAATSSTAYFTAALLLQVLISNPILLLHLA